MPKFKGTLQECLNQYLVATPDGKRVVADFCEASDQAVSDWSKGNRTVGQNLIRLTYFLLEQGFEAEGILNTDPTVLYLGKLVAFRVLTPQEMLHLIGSMQPVDYAWKTLKSNAIPYAVRSGEITEGELVKMYGFDLQAQIHKLIPRPTRPAHPTKPPHPARPRLRDPVNLSGLFTEPPPEDPEPVPKQAREPINEINPGVVMTAAALLNCLPYLRSLDIPNNSEVGPQLRSLMGADNFFDLLDTLKALSSRDAGRFFTSQSQH